MSTVRQIITLKDVMFYVKPRMIALAITHVISIQERKCVTQVGMYEMVVLGMTTRWLCMSGAYIGNNNTVHNLHVELCDDGRCMCLPSGEQKWQYLFDLN